MHTPTMSTRQAARAIGATYRQMDYWAARGLIDGQPRKPGSGSRREWTADQVAQASRLLMATRLRDGTLEDTLRAMDELLDTAV